ncbi:ABC transporter permease [Sporosarcina sp. ACRSM]|uniref:ABC transporter permease n=1 Tax=Sporosarcina sp. ACRSM TaxID=2918216 RepID=UPI001EF48520|nr:ABC transporter permease [Sporosarcina sp. ACRSM]MCG7335691.1 ABC transporter permease [Sporosarcina sp. ACRSM]
MLSIGRILFFMQQYHKQLKKKWGTLLLLFLFPIVLIGLLLGLVAGLLLPEENSPIRVALVDEDQTKESMLFGMLLEETATGNPFLQFVSLTEADAEELMERNEISTYFSFPEGFTADLYEGKSVTIPIVGNPAKQTESFVVKELVESMTRYIAAAQANILTINDYAKKTDLSKQERQELMFQQFMDFTLYTLGKDKLLDEEVITNVATSSPKHYYVLAGWFIVLSVWLLAIYSVLGKEEHRSMVVRMQLFGVTLWQRVFARMLVVLAYSLILAAVLFFIIDRVVRFELFAIDYGRFGLFTALYGLLFVVGAALIDVWVTSRKMGLLLQSLFLFLMILTSGALIPTLYFPQAVQGLLPYLFSYESMRWMIDIVLEGRNYADFTALMVYAISGLVFVWCSTRLKEGWKR